MSSLAKRILKNSTSKYSSLVTASDAYNGEEVFIDTGIPMLNTALSGRVDGGLPIGTTVFAGPSKHFKTLYGLYVIEAFQKKYPEGVVMFYDSEFGVPKNYLNKFDLDLERIIHTSISTVEELRHELAKQLHDFKENGLDDQVLIFVDSIGNLASTKEVTDAVEGNDKADMTRAKALKSLFRIIRVDLMRLKIPLVAVNHTYKSQDFIPRDIVSGGTGSEYNGDNIFIVSRKQEKEQKDVMGYQFTLKIEKSRFVREGRKIPIKVYWEDGIHKYSGLGEIADALGVVEVVDMEKQGRGKKPKGYKFEDRVSNIKTNDTDIEFWQYVLEKSDLASRIRGEFESA